MAWESMGSTGALGALRVLGIFWILNFCPLTFSLLRSVRGVFAPLLRVRSISSVTLGLLGEGLDRTRLIDTPSQTLERRPHGFVETVPIPSLDGGLQYLAYVGTVFRQLDRIVVIGYLFLVGLSMKVHRWMQNGVTNPNQSEGSANGPEDMFCGGGFDDVPVQNRY